MTQAAPEWSLASALPGLVWPALPSPAGARLLSVLLQLERSQWLPPEQLQQEQMRQIRVLLRHCHASVPFYREHWGSQRAPSTTLNAESFHSLPVLTRKDLQSNFASLKSKNIPHSHGGVGETSSSGSTGTPVRMLKTQFTQVFWNAFTLRDHLWQQRDLTGTLATIRHGIDEGQFDNWGSATADLMHTGPSLVRGVRSDTATQLRWLSDLQPEYLMTYPSNVAALARLALDQDVRLPRLRQVRTLGEVLAPDVRELCRQAWNVPVADVYSSDEAGYLALQCPEHDCYHVQSEGVLLEVIDDKGKPCKPGEIGRVIVTVLHNFAMPLVRYELGDYAELGANCPCGRGLPVIKRVLGRVRNMLVTADGKRYWPTFALRDLAGAAPILQAQFAQIGFDLIEARLVLGSQPSATQEDKMRQVILARLPAGFQLRFAYCDRIPRSHGGKFEDFVSEFATPRHT
jgi:phenylacetate-CoA ligase